ncbi:DUF2935 domain-containing protein [Cytobacillus sp. FJAT-54145]|uniref:DUF2935 domain-containing protein n=1 Tax=Cytobacillus spartinae TaxID=3299023 RepID=A0ABW6KDR6_9BACI
MAYQEISPWEEHRFWLEILKDHAYFVRDYLSPAEIQWVEKANQFIKWFEQVETQLSRISPNAQVQSNEMMAFSRNAYDVAYNYSLFEGQIMNLRLYNKININLTPTYFNGTLNENMEYLRILSYYMKGQAYQPLALTDLLDLWLEDQLGHAALLIRLVDGVEFDIIQSATALKGKFSQHIVKNNAIKGYLRVTQEGFPIQIRFGYEVAESVIQFNELVSHAVHLFKDDELINQATLRFLEHHFPESCYFMNKLSYYARDLQYPPCALTKYK